MRKVRWPPEEVEDQQVITDWTRWFATQLEKQGFTPEQARLAADREAQQAYRAYRAMAFLD